jgi:ATP-dependent Clp protease ATP-binding subunit ClpB
MSDPFSHALARKNMKAIVDIQIRGLLKRFEERKIHVELTETARRFIVAKGYECAAPSRERR